MKVTDKKFLNVHQTISPLSVATTVTATSTKGESSPSSKAEKILVSPTTSSTENTIRTWSAVCFENNTVSNKHTDSWDGSSRGWHIHETFPFFLWFVEIVQIRKILTTNNWWWWLNLNFTWLWNFYAFATSIPITLWMQSCINDFTSLSK